MSKEASLRRISIRSVRKNPPDYHKLGRALIQLAAAQAEAEAQAQQNNRAGSSASAADDEAVVASEDQT
jgi:hypothetical protein